MQLRPYQLHAQAAAWDYLRHRPGNPMLVLPTGAGKSPLMAALAQDAWTNWQGRVGILAHRQELVAQNADKLLALWPDAPMGIYAAGLRRRDRFEPILYMQIQSVAKRADALGWFDLLLVDEAHGIPLGAAGEGLYRQFIADCRRCNPALRIIGLSATPFRLQGRAVPVCGPEHVLTDIAYEARIPDLIRDGYLSPLVSKAGKRPDLSAVHVRGGEYVEAELAAAMLPLVRRTVEDLLVRAHERRAGIVFCVNIAHAEAVLAELGDRREHAALVHAGTPKAERTRLIADFQSGAVRWMVNVNVLSEGFDAPHIDCVAMLRPTKSPGLYYQQCGRGFRIAPGKVDCLVLDYAGNVLEHGPVDAIRVQAPRAGQAKEVRTGQAKECPACAALLPVAARACDCGYIFASADPAHFDRPIDAPILAEQRARVVLRLAVDGIAYQVHARPGKTPSLRVNYQCGLRRISEWVFVEHGGHARLRACAWWRRRAPGAMVPTTAEAALALALALPTPTGIVVDDTDKYPEVIGYEGLDGSREDAGHCHAGGSASGGAGNAGAHALHGLRRVPGWLLPALERPGAAGAY